MKRVALFFLFAIISTAFVFSKELPKIDFESDETGNFFAINETNVDVVLFIGSPDFDIVIGGVRKKSNRKINNRNIKMPKQGHFLVRVVTLERFTEKYDELEDDDFIYTGLSWVHEKFMGGVRIPSCIDVEKKYGICVSNESSKFVLELRKDGSTGDFVAAIAPGEKNKLIYLNPREDGMPYTLIPCFFYENSEDFAQSWEVRDANSQKRVFPRPISDASSFPIRFSDSNVNIEFKKPQRLFFE